ncbi:DNA mismatch repair protein [Didymella pomorum]|uniref:DNA mismatch repair protein n=1 Tax=Didymella pomorum TaxID=749634 RepID=A0A9W9D8Y2_9PLEO|nr:DNA mismatch repair protein [Didymella pomorum]
MSIRPLPDGVVAQIKSSTAIVSLSGVVVELLKNSLDAKAAKIDVTVEFARGGCTVEDDGLERQTPTAAHNHVYAKHGTRVTVRNLFGNMPVRVKQRALATDQKQEQARLRDALRKDVVGLLLSWQGLVYLKVRDNDNKTIVNFNISNSAFPSHGRTATAGKPRSTHLSFLLHVLTQANYINVDEWTSWVPASASTAALSIKGAISLDPSPTKQVQFISFGVRPLSGDNGCNVLYDEINRLFALSSFGAVEDDADVDEQEKLRRESDKRFKSDGYTNRQLKARKGVDRWPMFHLRIVLKNKRASESAEERFIENESNLQAVLGIFSAMITQWLSVHHFRPRKLHQLTERPLTTSAQPSISHEQNRTPSRKHQTSSKTPAKAATSNSGPVTSGSAKRKRPVMAPVENASGQPHRQAFADWSRIKSGKSSFFDTTCAAQKAPVGTSADCADARRQVTNHKSCSGENRDSYDNFDLPSINKGALSIAANTVCPEPCVDSQDVTDGKDETVLWTDPATNRTHLLNARTGSVMPPQSHQADSSATLPATARSNISQQLRMGPRVIDSAPADKPWLHSLLQTWDNPVFKPSEQSIRQMSLQNDVEDGGDQHPHLNHTHCSAIDMHKAFNDAGMSSARLSKDALRSAEVISQVDKKFVLVRMAGSAADGDTTLSDDIMVLIDQHAADERIQVEALLRDLCRPRHSSVHIGFRSSLGFSSAVDIVILNKPLQFAVSPHEYIHFETFARNFATWGILYDTRATATLDTRPGKSGQSDCKISITALPPTISERCKGDPQVLISLLRSALWKYAESPPLPPSEASDGSTSWVRKIATCPPGLVDMINSRACRSAIMFNDELSMEECKVLVGRLADCVFPFMCAHGRPSMVPIVDMARIGCLTQDAGQEGGVGSNFVSAWKSWKG